MNFLNRLQPLGLLVLRLALGTVMIAHGYQKVFGGMPQFMGMLSHMGIPPWMGYLTAAAEFGGGILLVVGFLTRLAALAIVIDMLVAIFKVHLHQRIVCEKWRLRVSHGVRRDCVLADLERRRTDRD